MKERVIKYKGLELNLSFDVNAIKREVRDEYKPEIAGLHNLLDKRHDYIHKLHQLIKEQDVTVFMLISASNISKKVKKIYNLTHKQMMILSYMSSINMAHPEQVTRYMKSIGMRSVTHTDMKGLVNLGYMMQTPLVYYYAATTEGKKIIKSIYAAFRQDYTYFIENRGIKRNHYVRAKKENKYSDEEKARRSEHYKQMMMPFWDGGYKVMPKNVILRIDYMTKWIQKRKEKGLPVDDMYYRLVEKWSTNP
mgnify:FL=1